MDINSVSFNGKQMKYCCFGNGQKPFVILPGLSINRVIDSAGAVRDAFALFENDYKVFLIDRIDNPPEGYSINNMSDDTAEAMSLMGIEKAVIFGASQGGMIAQEIGISHPGLADKLILASTAPKSTPEIQRTMERWIDLASKKKDYNLHMDTLRMIFTEAFLSKNAAVLPSFCGDLTDTERRDFIIFAKSCTDFNIENEIEKIRCPVFVLTGKKDKVIPYRMSELIADKTHAELYIYDKYGHSVYDEAPDFRKRILSYLAKSK